MNSSWIQHDFSPLCLCRKFTCSIIEWKLGFIHVVYSGSFTHVKFYFKVDRSTIHKYFLHKYFWYWLKQYRCIVWLFLWNISWTKINCQSSGWFSMKIYITNNNFLSMTVYLPLHNYIWHHMNYLKSINNIPAQFFRYFFSFLLLFYMGSRYDKYNYFWYYRPSAIRPITSLFKMYISVIFY